MNRDVFKKVHLASRRIASCEAVAKRCKTPIEISQVDADNVKETVKLLKKVKPDLVINMALPYQDLPIMDACLEAGVHYMDTANYEPRDEAKFTYKWQWPYHKKYKDAASWPCWAAASTPASRTSIAPTPRNSCSTKSKRSTSLTATTAATASRSRPTSTPRSTCAKSRSAVSLEGRQVDRDRSAVDLHDDRLSGSRSRKSYLIYHEEEESLVKNIKGLKQIRFWMTFSDNYIKHLDVLQSVGMTRIDPVMYKGTPVIPMEFLKELLPPPSSLGKGYTARRRSAASSAAPRTARRRSP